MADLMKEQSVKIRLEEALRTVFPESETVRHFSEYFLSTAEQAMAVDYMILHQEYGILIFEIKSYSINTITNINSESWFLNNYAFTNPYILLRKQFQAVVQKLDDRTQKNVNGHLFLVLPNINREEWLERHFAQEAIPLDHIIFSEDIEPDRLKDKIMDAIHP